MFPLVVLGLLVLLGAAALLGWTHDSRDPDYALGKLIDRPRR